MVNRAIKIEYAVLENARGRGKSWNKKIPEDKLDIKVYTEPLVFTGKGYYTIYYRAFDKA